MKTSNKRQYIEKNFPGTFDFINHNLNVEEYRLIDSEMQKIDDVWVLQYVITLLCDELVLLTNNNLTGE